LRKIHRESNKESPDNTSSDFTGDDSPEIASSGDHGRSGLSLSLMGHSGLPLLDGSFEFIGSPLDLSLWLSLSVFLSPSLFSILNGRKKKTRGRKKKKIKKERKE
jgi:hypothetical protein